MELAIDDLVVGDGVALDDDVADAGLLAFDDADFDVDRVAFDGHFDGSDIEEEVAVIHIHRRDVGAAGVVGEVGLEGGVVVGVALLDAQMLGEGFRRIDGVAREGDVAEEVGVTFVDVHLDLDAVLSFLFAVRDFEVAAGDIPDGVLDDAGVAVAQFVIVGDDLVEVVVEFEFAIFGAAPEAFGPEEELLGVVDIVGVLHLAQQLVGGHLFVAFEDERIDLDAFAFLDVVVEQHEIAFARGVGGELGCHLDIGEAFFGIIGLGLVAGSLEDVFGDDVADVDIEVFAQFFGVAAADAVKMDGSQFGAAAEDDFEEHLVVLDARQQDLHIFEDALRPQVVDGHRHLVARHLDDIAHLQTCDEEDHTLVEALVAVDGDATDFVGLRSQIVNIIIHISSYNNLCVQRRQRRDDKHNQEDKTKYIFHQFSQCVI